MRQPTCEDCLKSTIYNCGKHGVVITNIGEDMETAYIGGGSIKFFNTTIPYKCPVCKGTALVSFPPGVAGDQPSFTIKETGTPMETGPWTCRACDKGVIWK